MKKLRFNLHHKESKSHLQSVRGKWATLGGQSSRSCQATPDSPARESELTDVLIRANDRTYVISLVI